MTTRVEEMTTPPSPVLPPKPDEDESIDETVCGKCYRSASECTCEDTKVHSTPCSNK